MSRCRWKVTVDAPDNYVGEPHAARKVLDGGWLRHNVVLSTYRWNKLIELLIEVVGYLFRRLCGKKFRDCKGGKAVTDSAPIGVPLISNVATGVSLRKQVPVEMTDKPTAYRHIHRLNHATTRHGALRRHSEHRLYTPRNDPPAWRDSRTSLLVRSLCQSRGSCGFSRLA